MKTNKNDIFKIIIMLGVSTSLILLGALIFPLFIFLFPIPYIVIGVNYEPKYSIISFLIVSLFLGIAMNPTIAVFFAILFLPLIIGLIYSIKKGKKPMETIFINTLILLVSIVLIISTVQIISEVSLVSQLEKGLPKTLDTYMETFTGIESFDFSSEEALELRESLKERLEYTIIAIPAIIIIFSLIASSIIYTISASVLRRLGYNLNFKPKFSRFQLPSNILLGIGLMLLGTYFIGKLNFLNPETVTINLVTISSFLFIIQGLSVIDHKLISRKMRVVPRVLIIGVITIVLGAIVSFLGVMDIIFNFRKIGKDMGS